MAGLLYKDFIALKGKVYVSAEFVLLGITMLLRFFARIEGLDMLLFFLIFAVTMFSFLLQYIYG